MQCPCQRYNSQWWVRSTRRATSFQLRFSALPWKQMEQAQDLQRMENVTHPRPYNQIGLMHGCLLPILSAKWSSGEWVIYPYARRSIRKLSSCMNIPPRPETQTDLCGPDRRKLKAASIMMIDVNQHRVRGWAENNRDRSRHAICPNPATPNPVSWGFVVC